MQSTTLVGARWDEAGVRGNKGEIEKSFTMCTLPVANWEEYASCNNSVP